MAKNEEAQRPESPEQQAERYAALVESEVSLEQKRAAAREYVAGLGIGKVKRIGGNGQAGSGGTESR